jgi:hypothetical protein
MVNPILNLVQVEVISTCPLKRLPTWHIRRVHPPVLLESPDLQTMVILSVKL